MKRNNKFFYFGFMVQALMAHAESIHTSESVTTSLQDQLTAIGQYELESEFDQTQYHFDSSKLLGINPYQDYENNYKKAGGDFRFNKRQFGSVFLYKLNDKLYSELQLPSLPEIPSSEHNNLYGHLLTKLMQRLFIDLAAGYSQNNLNYSSYAALNTQSKLVPNYALGKNWFATASALFTHTWKEFIFNANLSASLAENNQDSFTSYGKQSISPLLFDKLHNKVSFLQENAELRYHASNKVQPFIDGGLLQIVDYTNGVPLMGSIMTTPNHELDLSGYKFGGGVSLNYKNYVFRIEQQYYQQGGVYHSNQSTLSVKMNIG